MAYSGAWGVRAASAPESGQNRQPPAASPASTGGGSRDPFSGALEGLFKKIETIDMETDDLILALILYLMYRESGDRDLLIMLGAMLLS
ncbi:MAG: hypothetical protein LUC89_01875 [Oscillospiraceae bacterium]|nr:hypothetical protein [Oscillospiraceae bacterium]